MAIDCGERLSDDDAAGKLCENGNCSWQAVYRVRTGLSGDLQHARLLCSTCFEAYTTGRTYMHLAILDHVEHFWL